MKGLVKSYHSDDIIICMQHKDSFGQNEFYICFLYNFPLFSESLLASLIV